MNIVHPEDVSAITDISAELLKDKSSVVRADFRLREKSGEYKWKTSVAVLTRHDSAGICTLVTGCICDISCEKDAEVYVHNIMDRAIFPIYEISAGLYVTYVNKAYCEMTGRPLEENLGAK